MVIECQETAKSQLRKIGYYRMSAYWYPFRGLNSDGTVQDSFKDGTNFNDVTAITNLIEI